MCVCVGCCAQGTGAVMHAHEEHTQCVLWFLHHTHHTQTLSLSHAMYKKTGERAIFLPRTDIEQGLSRSRCLFSHSLPARCVVACACVSLLTKAPWLILPVVICLSQRLSHACLSPSCVLTRRDRGRLIKSVVVQMGQY